MKGDAMFDKMIVIILGFLVIGGGISLLKIGVSMKIHKIMPPGYTLICNHMGKYKWSGHGYEQGYAGPKQTAIDAAWRRHKDGEFVDCSLGQKTPIGRPH